MDNLDSLFRQYCDQMEVFKGLSPRTTVKYYYALRRICQNPKVTGLHELNRLAIENAIIRGKMEDGWSPKYIRNLLQILQGFLDWCVDKELIESNPAKKIPKPKLPKRLPKSLTKDEALTILEYVKCYPYKYKFFKKRAVAIIATFLFTGIRRRELEMLKMSHVDFEEKRILVDCGKGDKERFIPLNKSLIVILMDYLRERNRLKKKCPYFFCAMRQDTRMGDKVIPRLFKELNERSEMHCYPHMLRHTFATLMLEGGCDLFSLSNMMGHTDIKTTTIYLSATVKHLQKQMGKHPLGN